MADAALLLDVISGPDPADSTSLRDAPPAASARLGAGVDGLRVGVVAELAAAEGIAPDVVARTRAAADALAAAGAKVEEVSVPAAVYGLSAYYLIAPAEASSNLARYDGVRYGLRVEDPSGAGDITEMYLRTRSAGFGAEVKRRIMLGTYALSAGYYDAYYGKAQQVRTLIIRDFEPPTSTSTCCWPRPPRRRPSPSAPRPPTRSPCTSTTCAPSRPTWPATRPSACPSASATTACRSACRSWRPPSARR